MKRGFSNSNLAALLLALALLCPVAHAENVADPTCVKNANIGIDSLDKILSDAGIDKKNVCKEQSKFDEYSNCKNSFKKLQEQEEVRVGIIKARCINQAKIAELDPNCVSDSCQTKRAGLVKWANDLNTGEQNALKQLQNYLKEVKDYQMKLAAGAEDLQRDSHEKSESAPNERTTNDIDKLGKAAGTSFQNNAQAATYFKDSLSTVSGLIEKVNSGEASASEVNSLKTGLAREPLQLAVASDSWSKQMKARQDTLSGQSSVYTAQAAAGTTNASSMGSLSNSANGLAAASQSASALNSSGTTSGTTADTSSYGSLSSGSPETVTTTVVQQGATSGTGGTYASNSMGVSTLAASNAVAIGAGTSAKADGTNGIKNIESLLAKNEDGVTGTTAASSSKGSALRSSLREKIAALQAGPGGGSPSTTGASVAPGSGAQAAANGVMAEGGSAALATPELQAVDLSAGADLGNLNFSMAGNETDAAVKNMVQDFTGSSQSANRALAAVYEQAPEILSRDSASLFVRARETHLRSLKKGLVINGLRSKL